MSLLSTKIGRGTDGDHKYAVVFVRDRVKQPITELYVHAHKGRTFLYIYIPFKTNKNVEWKNLMTAH